MSKKINPRRRPATQADIERAKSKATDEAVKLVVYMMLYVLLDKHDASEEDIQQFGNEVNYVADSVAKGYLNINDIIHTLEEEYHYTWRN